MLITSNVRDITLIPRAGNDEQAEQLEGRRKVNRETLAGRKGWMPQPAGEQVGARCPPTLGVTYSGGGKIYKLDRLPRPPFCASPPLAPAVCDVSWDLNIPRFLN